ncbi:nuclease-related domain-containing protein [uncultured Eubacterium sp.]|uniref:nuclease-related domain-containing protein n=1 Tax=uncultured Eubacterium sp. TaxID=165185 RepID=UPI0015B154EB|nr:nuclease-related domain-containing protein [uncultured Eubacterium sp.]
MIELYEVIFKLIFLVFITIFVVYLLPNVLIYTRSTYRKDTKKTLFSVLNDIGAQGEYRIYKYLRQYEKSGCKFLFNVYLPKNDETTEADVLLISPQGIYVFESKNYSGWIFGNERYKMWTQTLPQGKGKKAKKEKFLNPIMQNKLHMRCLAEYLQDDIPMYSIIVFSERCKLKKIELNAQSDVKVIKRNQINKLIRAYESGERKISDDKINEIYNKLYPLTQYDDDFKQKHIQDINNHISK